MEVDTVMKVWVVQLYTASTAAAAAVPSSRRTRWQGCELQRRTPCLPTTECRRTTLRRGCCSTQPIAQNQGKSSSGKHTLLNTCSANWYLSFVFSSLCRAAHGGGRQRRVWFLNSQVHTLHTYALKSWSLPSGYMNLLNIIGIDIKFRKRVKESRWFAAD